MEGLRVLSRTTVLSLLLEGTFEVAGYDIKNSVPTRISSTGSVPDYHPKFMAQISPPLLPIEIVSQIVELVASEETNIYRKLATLKSCRSVCHVFDEIVTPFLYRNVPFTGPHSFAKFLDELRAHPERGQLVRTLDFSAFTSVGLGRSRSCNTRILLLTAATLNECLRLCPKVEEVFLSEALESDIDVEVLRTLFIDSKHLKAVDFCASDCAEFVDCLTTFARTERLWRSDLSHLGLHNCSTLPSSFFDSFLPHFANLSRLDLYNTQILGPALFGIQETCRLRCLNLSQCTRITATDLLHFIISHPASRTLKSLSLLYSWNKTHPLSAAPQALDSFIQCLPRDLEVLDLAGVELDLQHLLYMPPTLLELGAHDIDVSISQSLDTSGQATADSDIKPMLHRLKYFLLTQNVISSEIKFAGILTTLFPKLSIIESPGFTRLPYVNSLSYAKIPGPGRRDWIRRNNTTSAEVEGNAAQWHPRKSNMSLSNGVPRGIYDYYSYRV